MILFITLGVACAIGIGLVQFSLHWLNSSARAARGRQADALAPCDPEAGDGQTIAVPVERPLGDAADQLYPVQIVPAREPAARVLNVLVADGDPAEQQLAAALLQAAGHNVTLVANGRMAIEAVGRAQYDIVLMAVRMPVMDGLQATHHIRACPSPICDLPIIAVTADPAPAAADSYRVAGMDACLRKPLSAPTVLGLIDALTAEGKPQRLTADRRPALDPSAIEMLREFLTADQLDALLVESLVDIDTRIQRLSVCLTLGNDAAAAKEAHDLVSVGGNCGASALSTLARDIERACKQHRVADAVRAFARMQDLATDAGESMTRLRHTLAGERISVE